MNWSARAKCDEELDIVNSLTRREFLDHIPQALDALDRALRIQDLAINAESSSATHAMESHGLSRWQQGFCITEVIRDWNHLRCAILEEIAKIVAKNPGIAQDAFADSVSILADLISEAVNTSAAKYEEIRQAEARSHTIDLRNTIDELKAILGEQTQKYTEASHDLAGHLGILSSLAGLFGKDINENATDELHSQLRDGIARSLQILEDLSYHAALESGHAKVSTAKVNLPNQLIKIAEPYRTLANKRGIEFIEKGPNELTVQTDIVKVGRIAQNLLHNAIKFTIEGRISIEWGEYDGNHFHIIVENSGTLSPTLGAMPLGKNLLRATKANAENSERKRSDTGEDTKPTILHRFSPQQTALNENDLPRVDTQREGIGLSIVKRLCELLSGRINIESKDEDYGVRATAILPKQYKLRAQGRNTMQTSH